ncbi:MAG: 5'-nucleotidase, partial [Cyanobacteriota bacterium]
EVSKKIIGQSSTYINIIRDEVRTRETTGGNFIVDAIKAKFPQVDVVFHNGGGIRGDKILPPGNISLLDIISMHPFQDNIVLFELTGSDIKSTLERSVSSLPYSHGGFLQVSGISFIADVSKSPQSLNKNYTSIIKKGNRISNVLINGSPLEDNKTYKVAANSFLINGGNGFLTMKNRSKNIDYPGVTITDVLEEYLKNNSPVKPAVEDRIQIINTPNITEE